MHRSIQRATSVPANPMLLEGALHRVGEMDNNEIRARIRKLLEADELPCEEPQKTWAGSGGGKHCAACGHSILPTEVEFEVDLVSGITLRLHRACHDIWLEECHQALS